VINNAGVLSKTNPLDGNAIEALKSEMDVNVYGLMAMAQAYAPILKKNSGSAFVQINSVASFRCSGKDVATYSATKAAAYSITQALAQELAPHDVRVLSVHPGPVRTEMLPERLHALAEAPSAVAEEVIRALEDGTLLHVLPSAFFF
jgi:short-subunit dehydrogenase